MDKNLKILKNAKLLYVEDDQEILEGTMEILSLFFDDITTATDGLEAVRVAKNSEFHIAIIDIMIPYKNGLEVAQEIREFNKDIVMFILSAYESVEILREALKLNMIGYLTKPFSMKSLKDTLYLCADKIKIIKPEFYKISNNSYYNGLRKIVTIENENINLTRNEIKLVELFIGNQDVVITYDLIHTAVFDDDNILNIIAIKNLIYRLKKKIPNINILNVADMGYIFKNE